MPLLCDLGRHQWEWRYSKQKSCEMQLVCTQCQQTKGPIKVEHESKHTHTSSDSCEVKEVCGRCGATIGPLRAEHEWETIARDYCVPPQICKRCGATGQAGDRQHVWRRITEAHPHDLEEKCERCGASRHPPVGLASFLGQHLITEGLRVSIEAATARGEPLYHLLLSGQPGMGKAALARAIAEEMGVGLQIVSVAKIRKPGELAAILTNLHQGADGSRIISVAKVQKPGGLAAIHTDLHQGDLLLIQEIESMATPAVEVLADALSDFSLDIVIGKGVGAHSIHLKLPKFTVVGTTAKLSQVDARLRHSMITHEFSPYDVHEIAQIILMQAERQGIPIDSEAAALLARYGEGCPAVAALVLRRAHQYAIVRADGQITPSVAEEAIATFGFEDRVLVPGNAGGGLQRARPPIPDDVKVFVWQRDAGRCVKCGSQENLEFDHIIPLAKGGSNTARNLQLLCEECNRRKGGSIA